MTIECHYKKCSNHSCHDENNQNDSGPYCDQFNCTASIVQIERWDRENRLRAMGYDLKELDKDNPFLTLIESDGN